MSSDADFDAGWLCCMEPGCEATVQDHYWGKTKAEGWFFGRDGAVWCPLHLPDWVPAWRDRNARRATARKGGAV